MSVFGGIGKGEHNRIKIRVRTAMASIAQLEGRFLGARPPYGYCLVDAGPHPNPGKAAEGRRLHKLEPDLATAGIVRRIFDEFLQSKGILQNPRYTGRQVWNNKDEVLIDLDDVALGHTTKLRWKDSGEWINPPTNR